MTCVHPHRHHQHQISVTGVGVLKSISIKQEKWRIQTIGTTRMSYQELSCGDPTAMLPVY